MSIYKKEPNKGSVRLSTIHKLIFFRFRNSTDVLEGDEGFGIAIIAQDCASVDVDLDDPAFDTWRICAINTDYGTLINNFL